MKFRFIRLAIVLSAAFIYAGATYASDAKKIVYRLQFTIPDLADTTLYLANYYGEKTYMTDTTKSDSKGRFVFTGTDSLPGGVYILAVGRSRVLEFIVNDIQEFSISSEGPDYVKNITVKGSPENQLFFEYMRFNGAKFQDVQPLQKELKALEEGDPKAKEITEKILEINKEVENYKLQLIKDHPNTFLATFFKLMQDIEIPDAPILANGKEDSTFAYRYYKGHYWDNIDLTDDRLLRTPVFHGKVDRYFDKIVVQSVDSLIREADKIIEISRPNKEMFKYLVWYLTIKYETSKVMGFDEIFVHLVDKYYSTGDAYWINPTVKKNITERADKLRPVLLGRVAPNMIMLDTNRLPVSMHNVQAKFTLLFFWDTDCGHCKKETPKLKAFYEEKAKELGLEVYAVCTDTSYAKMKKYLKSSGLSWINVNGPRSLTGDYHDVYDIYSTPVMYLLDEKKQIIAKRILTDQLIDFIKKYIEMQARKEE